MEDSDEKDELKSLEYIGVYADRLSKIGESLVLFLERFNGPSPSSASETAPSPPSTYRTDIDRLDRNIREVDALVDLVTRLG